MALTAAERKQRQRDRERAKRDIVTGAKIASAEKHETAAQCDERTQRALAHHEWLQAQESPHNSTEEGIKAYYGYSASETRTATERNAAAQRMVSKATGLTGLPAVR